MTEARFTVPGEPAGKGRPRFARAGDAIVTYTPERTRTYQELVGWSYREACGQEAFPDGTPLETEIDAYFAIPKKVPAANRELMERGLVRPTKRPDADNIAKSVCDGLNGVAYKDDSVIVSCTVRKYYGASPRAEIIIREAGGRKEA